MTSYASYMSVDIYFIALLLFILYVVLLAILIFLRERLPRLNSKTLALVGFTLLVGETILIAIQNFFPNIALLRTIIPCLAITGTLLQTPYVMWLVFPRRAKTKKSVLELIDEKDGLLRRVEEIDSELGFRTRGRYR